MESKGTMSHKVFQDLLSRAPSSSKSDAFNAGALKEWRRRLKERGIDIDLPVGLDEFTGSGKKKKTSAKPGNKMVKVLSPSGKQVEIPESELEAALSAGGKRL